MNITGILVRALVRACLRIDALLGFSRCAHHWRRLSLLLRMESHGPGISLQFPLVVEHPEHVRMGAEVSIAAFVHIWGDGGVTIGDRVLIGSHTAIVSETHDPAAPRPSGTAVCKPVAIEDDVWIGAHAVILPGVRVGKGAIVGAGAVVTRDVPERAVVAGVPARVLRQR